MATPNRPRPTIAPQLEICVHRRSVDAPVTARLDLVQARELIARLSLMDPQDAAAASAMKGSDPARLLLGLQSFYRSVLEREGCVALADIDGDLWTIPARAVDAVMVRLVTGIARRASHDIPVSLPRSFVGSTGAADTR